MELVNIHSRLYHEPCSQRRSNRQLLCYACDAGGHTWFRKALQILVSFQLPRRALLHQQSSGAL
jgi:hypothetical protein